MQIIEPKTDLAVNIINEAIIYFKSCLNFVFDTFLSQRIKIKQPFITKTI